MKIKPIISQLLAGSALLTAATFVNALEFADNRFTVSTVKEFNQKVTKFVFSPNSDHLFIAEEEGVVIVYDNINDTTASMVLNIKDQVNDYVDHGLLGMAVHPNFPATPWMYVMYSYGNPDTQAPANARLSRFTIDTNTMTATSEDVWIQNWCQNSLSHGIGDVHFGPDGALYVTAGDGADPQKVDTGGDNCGDPWNEGGALRSQDYRTTGDPLGFNGTLLRLDPATGAALPDNPNFGQDANYARVVAYGLRNPFRFTIHPVTNEIFISDVGWDQTEEINYVPNPTDGVIENFGWPCFEGDNRQGGYQNANTDLCNQLYNQGNDTKGFYTYDHNGGQACPTGIDFYLGGGYPAEYVNDLFFADYSRRWIKYFNGNPDGSVNAGEPITFAWGDAIVDMQRGPGGDLFYLEYQLNGGWFEGIYVPRQFRLRRISGINQGEIVANIEAPVLEGAPGLTVNFSANNSTHPQGNPLTFNWDLDGDGQFDDAFGATPEFTYNTPGVYPVSLRASDVGGNSAIANAMVLVSSSFPEVTINAPTGDFTWATGDAINFSGSAINPETQQQVTNLTWNAILHHCAKNDATSCHTHEEGTFTGATGSLVGPDHEYPSRLELRLEATGELGGVEWFDTAWQKRRAVFINNDNGLERNNQALFIELDDSMIDYQLAGNNGASLRFVDANGNVVPHDIGSWNNNNISQVWVNVVNVPADSTNQYVWMYYDNPAANSTSTTVNRNNQDDIAIVSGEYVQSAFTSSTSVDLQPVTAIMTLDTIPSGLTVGAGSFAAPGPQQIEVIQGSLTTISAIQEDNLGAIIYGFDSWAHGGERQQVVSTMSDVTYIATYAETGEFQCNVNQVYFRGTPNAWATTAMTVADVDDDGCIWEINAEFSGAANDRFKFDINGDWAVNYGDDNNDGFADLAGDDIFTTEGAGNYYITFHSVTHAYTVTQRPAGPQAPVAVAAADQTVVRMHTDVTFDGSASTDADSTIVSYVWTSGAWEGELTGVNPMFHFHDVTGDFVVTLTVTDDTGLTGSDDITITVNPLQPPVAVIDGGNVTVGLGETVTFASTGSSDPDGEIVAYMWDNGDNTATSTRTFNTLGDFVVSLTVTDDNSISDSDSITVTVIDEPPVSEYDQVFLRGSFNGFAADTNMTLVSDNLWTATATFAGAANDRFKFDIFGDWTLNFGSNGGDNIADQTGGDIFITEGAGDYFITFNDLTKEFSVTKNVGPVGPDANAGADQNVRPGTTVSFNGSSVAGDAAVTTYSWTSTAWAGELTGANPTFTFASEGTFTVTLTVTDANDMTDADTMVVTVAANQLPVADIANGNITVVVGSTITFDGAASSDADGSIAGYLWDNGDATATSTRTFDTVGTEAITLVVTDNEGAESTVATVTVTVVANQAPVATIANGDITITEGDTVTFDGSASSDADGSIAGYLWDNGDVTATSTRTFNTAGAFVVTLVVTDDQGLESALVTVNVTVEEAPAGVDVNFTCNNGNTVNGQSVYVVGNIPELGNWAVTSATQKLNPNGWPTWSNTLNVLPANTTIEWKCVIADEQTLQIIQWQGGGNNVVTTGATGTFNSTGNF